MWYPNIAPVLWIWLKGAGVVAILLAVIILITWLLAHFARDHRTKELEQPASSADDYDDCRGRRRVDSSHTSRTVTDAVQAAARDSSRQAKLVEWDTEVPTVSEIAILNEDAAVLFA